MYNGIGLLTARGSGTSGHITKNTAHLRSRDDAYGHSSKQTSSSYSASDRMQRRDDDANGAGRHRQPDQAILDHQRKRKVEVKCMELRTQLEDMGLGEADIEEKVATLRQQLVQSLVNPKDQSPHLSREEVKALRPSDTHARQAAKVKETQSFGRALGIRPDYEEGQAFDKDYQEKRRIQRQDEWQQRNEERQLREQQRQTAWKERHEEMSKRRQQEDEERERFEAELRENTVTQRARPVPAAKSTTTVAARRSPSFTPPAKSQRQRGSSLDYNSRSPSRYDSPSPSPPRGPRKRRDSIYDRSRSPSPRARQGRQSDRNRGRSFTPSNSDYSRSPPPRRAPIADRSAPKRPRRYSRDRSPAARLSRSYSRSPSPPAPHRRTGIRRSPTRTSYSPSPHRREGGGVSRRGRSSSRSPSRSRRPLSRSPSPTRRGSADRVPVQRRHRGARSTSSPASRSRSTSRSTSGVQRRVPNASRGRSSPSSSSRSRSRSMTRSYSSSRPRSDSSSRSRSPSPSRR